MSGVPSVPPVSSAATFTTRANASSPTSRTPTASAGVSSAPAVSPVTQGQTSAAQGALGGVAGSVAGNAASAD